MPNQEEAVERFHSFGLRGTSGGFVRYRDYERERKRLIRERDIFQEQRGEAERRLDAMSDRLEDLLWAVERFDKAEEGPGPIWQHGFWGRHLHHKMQSVQWFLSMYRRLG